MNLWHSLRCIATRITAITKICTEMLRNDGHWVLANFVTRSGLARLSPSHHGILSCPRLIHSYAQLPLLCGIEQYHVVEPIAISGNDLVVLRISDRKVADTKLCPIEYDFYRLTEPIPGTVLLLPGCTRKLADALLKGLSHFFSTTRTHCLMSICGPGAVTNSGSSNRRTIAVTFSIENLNATRSMAFHSSS